MRAESSANSDAATKPLSATEWLNLHDPKRSRRRRFGQAPQSAPQPATSRSYEAFLQSVSVEDLAALSEEAAQATGSTDPQILLREAWLLHRERSLNNWAGRKRDKDSRRRARKRTTTVELFRRGDIIDRDNRTCHLCGKGNLEDSEIHLDHVIPLAKGGAHTADNVKVACAPCNIRKGANSPSDSPG